MKLSIYAYGHPVLREQSKEITNNDAQVASLIENMWETMYNANGCGLAANQVGEALQLFIVDSEQTFAELNRRERRILSEKGVESVKETFINAKILERSDKSWDEDEGCLSIPGLSQNVNRPWSITIEYLDRNFELQQKTFHGPTARMIQHEFDHTKGVLYLDYLKPVTQKMMESKLKKIVKGQVKSSYPMYFVEYK
ncbi:peptide deformylase [Chondrinema litorale]|uniref:peptide deformylase n=1 Tax=Chondrinema litorale TaxID=2994555 RepID=UPI0025439E2C|nr:peptide deformylase [Chondrinema litorale]UZR97476.1 peptide deformylase [Chondrinema litorale]